VKRLSVFALACCVVVAAAALHALPQTAKATPKEAYSSTWRRIVTGDLVVSGNAPSPTLTRIVGELTRFRETFRELFPKTSTSSPTPTWVVVLRDYATFQGLPRATAEAARGPMSAPTSRRARTSI
jgi:hypothetical protein